MTSLEVAQLISPFIAVLTASGWIHGQFTRLREEVAALKVRVELLEHEVRGDRRPAR